MQGALRTSVLRSLGNVEKTDESRRDRHVSGLCGVCSDRTPGCVPVCLSAPALELQRRLRSRRSQQKSGSPAQDVLRAAEAAPVPKGFVWPAR